MTCFKKTGFAILLFLTLGLQWAAGGLITSVSVDAMGATGVLNNCTQNGTSAAGCTASVGTSVSGTTQATAGYGSVTASIQGGAYAYGGSVSVTSSATFTDTLTIFGGSGTGTLTLNEFLTTMGTGTLQTSLNSGAQPVTVSLIFAYGVPFTISLTAQASNSFLGAYGDAGSLSVTRGLSSLSVSDATGKAVSGLTWSDTSGYGYTFASGTVQQPAAMPLRSANNVLSTPEPSTWVLGVLGLALLVLSRVEFRRDPRDQDD